MSAEEIQNAINAPYIPIVYGNVAMSIGKPKAGGSQDHSHKWMVFVRGAANQDISYAISKVVFELHETYALPRREITEPPYQVTETSWGFFPVKITIYFRDESLPPIEFSHTLKLNHEASSPEKIVTDEIYEEIVFNDLPKDSKFRQALLKGSTSDAPLYPFQNSFTIFNPEADLEAIRNARQWTNNRADEFERRIAARKTEAEALKQKLIDLGVL